MEHLAPKKQTVNNKDYYFINFNDLMQQFVSTDGLFDTSKSVDLSKMSILYETRGNIIDMFLPLAKENIIRLVDGTTADTIDPNNEIQFRSCTNYKIEVLEIKPLQNIAILIAKYGLGTQGDDLNSKNINKQSLQLHMQTLGKEVKLYNNFRKQKGIKNQINIFFAGILEKTEIQQKKQFDVKNKLEAYKTFLSDRCGIEESVVEEIAATFNDKFVFNKLRIFTSEYMKEISTKHPKLFDLIYSYKDLKKVKKSNKKMKKRARSSSSSSQSDDSQAIKDQDIIDLLEAETPDVFKKEKKGEDSKKSKWQQNKETYTLNNGDDIFYQRKKKFNTKLDHEILMNAIIDGNIKLVQ